MNEPPQSLGRDVLFEVVGHVAIVSLNRPEKRNAINGGVTEAMSWICERIDSNAEIRAAVLASSTPGMFCAGADLSEVAKDGGIALVNEYGGFGGFVRAPRRTPWIAAVDGPAMGGGFEFALACDMIVASSRASFALPEVKRGLYAAGGGAFRLPRAIPLAIANQILATGDPLDVDRARQFGLVNSVVEPNAAVEAAIALAESVAANAPVSVAESLFLARLAAHGDEEASWTRSNDAMLRVMTSEDSREGPRAFLEKRAPQWKGN